MTEPIARTVKDFCRIRSIEERAQESGISAKTLRRMIWRGEGPPIIRLSPRRLGISDRDWETWLESRRASHLLPSRLSGKQPQS
jgi:predicted DNA-binding transcriptional regulator AlpA